MPGGSSSRSTSRKRFLGLLLAEADGTAADGPTEPDDRLEGSLATAVWSYAAGARAVRAHDRALERRERSQHARRVRTHWGESQLETDDERERPLAPGYQINELP